MHHQLRSRTWCSSAILLSLLALRSVALAQPTITEYRNGLTPGGAPWGIAAGPDGAMWFTEYAGRIGRISLSGVITEYSAGLQAGDNPAEIAAGSDGALWFVASTSGFVQPRIGRISTAGVITEFPITPASWAGSYPCGITLGPDGSMWFADAVGGVGRITTAGAIDQFTGGTLVNTSPQRIAVGPDGALWFKIGRASCRERV